MLNPEKSHQENPNAPEKAKTTIKYVLRCTLSLNDEIIALVLSKDQFELKFSAFFFISIYKMGSEFIVSLRKILRVQTKYFKKKSRFRADLTQPKVAFMSFDENSYFNNFFVYDKGVISDVCNDSIKQSIRSEWLHILDKIDRRNSD